jgi:hypothetical protein
MEPQGANNGAGRERDDRHFNQTHGDGIHNTFPAPGILVRATTPINPSNYPESDG